MSNIDIKRARYFLKLSETLNFSEAAKSLGISQPGLTKAISHLEQDVGATLIRREGRNTHLTHVGSSLVEHFARLVGVAETVEEETRKLVSGDMPVIRLGFLCSIGSGPLSNFLARFRLKHPHIEVVVLSLDPSNISEILIAGDVDIAFTNAELIEPTRFKTKFLYQEKMVVASSRDHMFADLKSVTFEQVTQEPYIDRLQCEFRQAFLYKVEQESLEASFAVRTDNETLSQVLVGLGVGVTILPEFSVENSNVVTTPLADVSLERTITMAVSYGREDTDVVRSFLQEIVDFGWPGTND